MDTYTKIAQAVKAIVGSQKASLFTATVKSVDDTVCTVDVGGMELTDVRLRSVVNNDQGRILVTPKVGSTVLIGDLSNGAFTDLAVLRFAEVDKVEVTIDSKSLVLDKNGVVVNDGSIGCVKADKMVEWMMKVYSDLQMLVGLLSTSPVTGNGASLAITFEPTTPQPQVSDFADDAFKH